MDMLSIQSNVVNNIYTLLGIFVLYDFLHHIKAYFYFCEVSVTSSYFTPLRAKVTQKRKVGSGSQVPHRTLYFLSA